MQNCSSSHSYIHDFSTIATAQSDKHWRPLIVQLEVLEQLLPLKVLAQLLRLWGESQLERNTSMIITSRPHPLSPMLIITSIEWIDRGLKSKLWTWYRHYPCFLAARVSVQSGSRQRANKQNNKQGAKSARNWLQTLLYLIYNFTRVQKHTDSGRHSEIRSF